MTFEELKSAVMAAAPKGSLNIVGGRARLTASAEDQAAADQRAALSAWGKFMANAVCGRGGDLPTDADTSAVVIDPDRSMYSTVGGGVILSGRDRAKCCDVGYRVAASAPERGWVAARVDGELFAMSVEEAFRRGLREEALPKAA